MSLSDKILDLYEKYGSLSSERVTFLLEKEFDIIRNIRTIQRKIRRLVNEKKLVSLPLKGREQSYEVYTNHPSLLSSAFLSRIWDELFTIREETHYPKKQFEKSLESFRRLSSLIQLLPEEFKQRIKPKIDSFGELDKEEWDEIGNTIGFKQILTIGGVAFGDDEMARKIRKQEMMGFFLEKRIEDIIGEISSYLHEVIKEQRIKS